MECLCFGHICLVPWRLPVPEWASLSQDLGNFLLILLNLFIPLAFTFSPSLMPMIHKLHLLKESLSSCIFLLQLFSLLSNNSSVFSSISIVFEP
jgi:hypothetical protein